MARQHEGSTLWLMAGFLSWGLVQAEGADALRGRVQDGAGNALHLAEVLVIEPGTYQILRRTFSDHHGEFTFSSLPQGELELSVSYPGMETVTIRLSKGQREVIVVLAPGIPKPATEVSVFGVSPRTAASSSTLRDDEFTKRPIEDPADVLRLVPGLVVAQHAGGGKGD